MEDQTAYDEFDESDTLALLMEEPPGGHNHGRTTALVNTDSDHPAPKKVELSTPGRREFLVQGGWSRDDGKTHRGVLHPAEYVDKQALHSLVEEALGYSLEQVASVYDNTGGSLPAHLRQLRDKLDSRLLALSRSGGNMTALARIFGWPLEEKQGRGGARSKKMERAIARARAVEGA